MPTLFYLIFLLITCALQAHGDHEEDWEKIQPFKERIHNLCSGHGLMHMEDAVLNSILDRFANHADDVIELQEAAADDSFLVQLSVLIHKSNLTPEQKQEGYRRSYEIVLKNLKAGDEWKRTLWFLLRDTNALTQEEITTHLEAKDPGVRADAKKALEKLTPHPREKPVSESNFVPDASNRGKSPGNNLVKPAAMHKELLAIGTGLLLVFALLTYKLITRK